MKPSLLLVAHGSADPAATANVLAVTARLQALRPEITCAAGFLERAEPTAADTLARLPPPVVAVPYLLAAAHHATVDVRELGADAVADVLGADPALLPVAIDRLTGSGDAGGAYGAVVLATAGTSHEDANAVTTRFAALLGERIGRPVTAAFASAASPTVAEALTPGCVVLRWLLSPGQFADRIAAAAGEAPVTAVIGDHPAVAALLLERYDAAAAKLS